MERIKLNHIQKYNARRIYREKVNVKGLAVSNVEVEALL